MEKNNNLDLLTIVLVILMGIFFMCYYKNEKVVEKMTCIFNKEDEQRLGNSYLWDEDYQKNYMFKLKKDMIPPKTEIEKLKKMLMKKSIFSDDSKKIREIFKEPKKVVHFIEEMIDFLLIDDSKDYKEKIDTQTPMNLIIQLLLILRIRKLFHCRNLQGTIGDDAPSVNGFVAELLSNNVIKLCSRDELLNYCRKFDTNVRVAELDNDILSKELQAFQKGENLELSGRKLIENFNNYERSFGLFSVEESVNNFGDGYYKDITLNRLLVNLINKFEKDQKKKYKKLEIDHLKELIILFLKDIHPVLDEMNKLKAGDFRLYELQIKFNPMRELFYNLKFHYKILSIYNLINDTVDNVKDKADALKCCSNGKGQCFNFGDDDEQTPIVFGTNDYGFRKDTKCFPESKASDQKKQNMLLSEVLKEESVWVSLDDNIKKLYLLYLEDLVNYMGDIKPQSSDKTASKTVLYFMKKLSKLDDGDIRNMFISKLRSNLRPIVYENNQFMTKETKNIINLIEETSDFNKIVRLINDTEAGKGINKNFDFVALERVELIKFSVIKLLELSSLFIHVKANKDLKFAFMKIMLNLKENNLNYYSLLKKVGVLPRDHGFFLEKFCDILKGCSYYCVPEKIMLSKKPKEVISHNIEAINTKNPLVKNIFPIKKDDVCDVFRPILYILRSQKKITPKEYLKYKKLISRECIKRYQIYDPNEKRIEPATNVEDDLNKMITTVNNFIDGRNKFHNIK